MRYFGPSGPYPSSPHWDKPQLIQESSAPTTWCILPESMQRIFQPLLHKLHRLQMKRCKM